jgi:geranylgeranylglycerol-phosphate geranylgeranyltransferase
VNVLSNPGDLILLTRPHNGLIGAASILIGAFLARGDLMPAAVYGSLMALFVCSGAYVLNDVYDVATDRVNKPGRPLAAGRVSKREAADIIVVLWAVGGAFALLSGGAACAFYIGWIALLWLYSWRLKARGWIGHVLVSVVAASGFVLGASSAGVPSAGVVPFAIAFLFHLAREIAKGVHDLRGDEAAGLTTLAVRVGPRRALAVLLLLLGAVAVAGLLPYVSGLYGGLYFLPVAAIVYPLLGACAWLVVRARRGGLDGGAAAGAVSRMLKAGMPAGLLAFLLAGV